jgi:acetyl esterase/lipase
MVVAGSGVVGGVGVGGVVDVGTTTMVVVTSTTLVVVVVVEVVVVVVVGEIVVVLVDGAGAVEEGGGDVDGGVVVRALSSPNAALIDASLEPHAAVTSATAAAIAATRRMARPVTALEGTWHPPATVREMWHRGAAAAVAVSLLLGGCSSVGTARTPPTAAEIDGPQRIAYGDHADAFGDLWLPVASAGAPSAGAPVVVLIHGGFWRADFQLDLMEPLVPSLLEEGFAVWNIEYRRVGAGGGYPQTFVDAAAAIDRLADLPPRFDGLLDLGNVSAVGHSAGGQLAVWLASRRLLPVGAPGVDPEVIPSTVVSQAGVLDLIGCVEAGIGGTACSDLIGATPDTAIRRYAETSPAEMLPIEAAVVAVHGSNDAVVPVAQSEVYIDRATVAGVRARLEMIDDADHFSHLDPTHAAWLVVIDVLTS